MKEVKRSDRTFTTKGQKIYGRESISVGNMYQPSIRELPDYSAIDEALREDLQKGFIHSYYMTDEIIANVVWKAGEDFNTLKEIQDKYNDEWHDYTAFLLVDFSFLEEYIERIEKLLNGVA